MLISPYTAASPEKLAEIIRLAEARLAAQLTLGVAADQRAMTLASFLIAADAAILAVTSTSASATMVPLMVLLGGFALAAGLAVWSALPVAWEAPGGEPCNWLTDLAGDNSCMSDCNAARAEYYDDMLRWNDKRLKVGANWVRAAFAAALLSLLCAALLAAVTR